MRANGLYSAAKALWHTDKIRALRKTGRCVPAQIQLVISDLCNHDCMFCAYRMSGYTSNQMFGEQTETGVNNNPNRMIPLEKCYEILEDAANLGVRAVQFTGGGEPTVHPHHMEGLRKALDLGMECSLVTNGNVLRSGWEEVLPRFSWIRLSLDAGSPSTYANIRHVKPATFHKVLTNIEKLAAVTAKTECVFGVSFIVTNANAHEVADAARIVKNHGASSIRVAACFSPMGREFYTHQAMKDATAGIVQAGELIDDDFKVIDMFLTRLRDVDGAPEYEFCGYQQFNVYIGADLNVYRCCNTAYNERGLVGSITDRALIDFWRDPDTTAAYVGFDARGCERCAFNDQNRLIGYAVHPRPLHVNFV